MSFITSKTYVLANGIDYTTGVQGIPSAVSVNRQPTFLSPGPFTNVPTINSVGAGLTVDITTIDGTVKTITGFASTSGYTPGTYTGLATNTVGAGTGTGLTADVVVGIGGLVSSVTINNSGQNYTVNRNIKINGGLIGGSTPADNVTFQVATISSVINTVTISTAGKKYMNGFTAIINMDPLDGTADGILNIDTTFDGPISRTESWIMNIHVLVTNTANVEITHAGGYVTVFPAGSLVAGATYPYSVKTIFLDGGDTGSILGMAPGGRVELF
jgi:hypothetical protein